MRTHYEPYVLQVTRQSPKASFLLVVADSEVPSLVFAVKPDQFCTIFAVVARMVSCAKLVKFPNYVI